MLSFKNWQSIIHTHKYYLAVTSLLTLTRGARIHNTVNLTMKAMDVNGSLDIRVLQVVKLLVTLLREHVRIVNVMVTNDGIASVL